MPFYPFMPGGCIYGYFFDGLYTSLVGCKQRRANKFAPSSKESSIEWTALLLLLNICAIILVSLHTFVEGGTRHGWSEERGGQAAHSTEH